MSAIVWDVTSDTMSDAMWDTMSDTEWDTMSDTEWDVMSDTMSDVVTDVVSDVALVLPYTPPPLSSCWNSRRVVIFHPGIPFAPSVAECVLTQSHLSGLPAGILASRVKTLLKGLIPGTGLPDGESLDRGKFDLALACFRYANAPWSNHQLFKQLTNLFLFAL
jgi:hypothetical protein